jgi:hypothetical protein
MTPGDPDQPMRENIGSLRLDEMTHYLGAAAPARVAAAQIDYREETNKLAALRAQRQWVTSFC